MDHIDIELPCVGFDTTTLNYTISGDMLTITIGGSSDSFGIVTLTKTMLSLKSSSSSIIEYRRTV
ncbi:hypothetical protein GCM10023314_05480 [Algibacter agarivorans]|uniref:Lipocalin-like domain-containing protein n=1 Tax=Algibacter agarivorans TaxID=1109741 RepID=A0ABP9GBS5_9FLAO